MKIERDRNGKTRVAKGDRSGLGGQYAPDIDKISHKGTPIDQINIVSRSSVAGAPDGYSVKLTDACQQCGETKLAPHEIKGGFLKRKVLETRIRCQNCDYDQKDMSFLHMS